MRSVILLVLLIASVLGDVEPAMNLKNGSAPGHHHEKYNGYGHKDHEYERHYRTPPLIDQFVCDLDATILVVASSPVKKEEQNYGQQNSYGNNGGYGAQTGGSSGYGASGGSNYQGGQDYGNNGGYGQPNPGAYGAGSGGYGAPPNPGYNSGAPNGYGESQPAYGGHKEGSYSQKSVPNAVRLKCSHIATRSEHDCNSCCALAARRDHSVSQKDIFGFIIDADELINSEYGLVRHKRNANSYPPPPPPPTPAYPNPQPPAQPYESSSPSTYPAAENYPVPPQGGYPAETPAPSYGQPAQDYSSQPGQDYSSGGNTYSSGHKSSGVGYLQHPYPPKNGRCVCCAPKGYERHYERSHRRHHHERRRYEDSDEY